MYILKIYNKISYNIIKSISYNIIYCIFAFQKNILFTTDSLKIIKITYKINSPPYKE